MSDYPKVEIREGLVSIIVPDLSKYIVGNRPEPAHAPVFYNPRMEVNRSLSIAIINGYVNYTGKSNIIICEPLSGTGVRAIRYAREINGVSKVISNDISERAYELIRMNIDRNGLSDIINVHKDDANNLLLRIAREGGCDVIDIDPFGSPQPFIENSLRAIRDQGLLCVTATDVGVLSGKYPIKCVRRYGALPQKFPYRFEVGIRILISTVARYALSMDYGIRPLMSFLDGHYYRVCMLVFKDRAYALETLRNIGYSYYRPSTLQRGFISGYPIPGVNRYRLSGPLWIGNLWDAEFLMNYFMKGTRDYFSSRAREVAGLIGEEALGPNIPYALTTEVGRDLGRELPINDVISIIRGLGYQAVRSHFHVKGFRTNADLLRIKEIIMGK
ncbi:tRNA (guanine-N(2)-)-methyltransferase [Vulcanisaeta moutnovskia 768-28]|uniref:tRNA (guanine(26)-N(2))-dimethyltransferase n=1 Tax=Vulcanisaeta moutnovskia (strain 768-28) TaxID=985053 RepID=F0QSL3_VULM7|nr:tRNA (guanine(26)-N(2))-dimethyltransferase [Vulcanisaeta moutnovskia]ADY01530.1 tRNA (guanine-N(2)-)-methyltransferase [Vulcanisaeta moutnovskia 768-28]